MAHPIPASLRPEHLEVLPLERARTLPACAYTDPLFHGFDLDAVIARSWQPVGRAGEVRRSGDHVAGDIAGKPILVVRGSDGVLRGFFNVCKHRGGPLVLGTGSAASLHCRYHGWTYALDGGLRRAPEMEGAVDFDPASVCLDPVSVGEWGGLVLAAPGEPLGSLGEFFAGIRGRMAPLEPAALAFHTRVTYELACNWKVYVDNYLEGYHLPHVHPALNRMLDYRAYAVTLDGWRSWQHSPLATAGTPYVSGNALYCHIFPNLMLNVLPDRLQTNVVVPLSAASCRVIFDFYYPEDRSSVTADSIAADLRFSDDVQREDIDICERVQKGLGSGAYGSGRLSVKREAAVHHFHNLLREAYRQASA